MKRAWQAVVAAVGLAVAVGTSGRAAEPAAAEIAAWIEQLGSPQFARREAASKSLVAAGEPAVEPLVAAIRTGDLEVASRGIEILRDMLAAEPNAAAAAAALDRCAETASPAVTRLAEAALSFHRLGLEAAARARLEELGAVVREPAAGLEIEFGRDWKGSVDDLRELTRLPEVMFVAFHGVPLDERAPVILGRLEGLERLELFGTGLADDAIAALAARLVDTRIDVRRGGKLGVGALAFGGPCEIQTVQPGSAADQAGIRPGDTVLAVDGVPVADFDGLTTRVAGRGPGEVVRLTVARRSGAADEDERLEFEVRLDAW
ncbi:MAG: PDZ domain-containing protein [Planctomycetota bacterium]